jgi:hypothetical protein
MKREQRVVLFGLLAAVLALFFLYEAYFEIIGDGSVSIKVTVRTPRSFQIRQVTYDNFGQKAAMKECLRYPQGNEGLFREAFVEGPQTFQFDVWITTHTSPFGIIKNRFNWEPFAVFRIETVAGTVHYVGAEIADVRKTRSITIDIP